MSKITADDGKAFERINADDPSILDKLIKLPGVHSWYIHEAHPDLPTRSSMRALSVLVKIPTAGSSVQTIQEMSILTVQQLM